MDKTNKQKEINTKKAQEICSFRDPLVLTFRNLIKTLNWKS